MLFDRLRVPEGGGAGKSLLIIGAGGGVGSILTQLARQLTQLTVIGSVSRDATREWVTRLGAHHTVDHTRPMQPQLAELGLIRYIPFPDDLKGRYQSYTQADVTQLRAAGFTAPMRDVQTGVAEYVRYWRARK